MIRQETGEATALLLQRVLICPSRDEISIEEIKNMVTPVIEHQNGSGDYRPMHLRECGEDREVVLYADAGIAVIDQPNDSLKAVYVANGLFQKTVENMNRLRSRGTIDFEGTLRIQLLTEQVVAQIDERTGLPTVIRNSSPSDPVLVNRIDGQQSHLFSRVDEIVVLCPVRPGRSFQGSSLIQFETLTRVDVSTRSEPEPIHYQDRDLESAVLLGEGICIWPSRERHTDRYGFISLSTDTEPGSGHISLDVKELIGKVGSLACQIIETRVSPMEDHFRGLVAQTPDVGEIIGLGKGTLQGGYENAIGLEPDDGREIDWLNPKALYRCHLQTVRLWFLPAETSQQFADS